ncbi:MAG: squalene/phytoene synthase family protein [Kordiimonadaceae bacterium]|nr:squalene/phytoene synthase family protein [Kordiimonadaceae bacterium]
MTKAFDTFDTEEYCRDLVKQDDRDRYLVSLFAPAAAQVGLWAIFAFNQEVAKVRETVSEPMLGEIRLQWWHDVVQELATGAVREKQPVIQAMAAAQLPASVFPLLEETITARKNELLGEGTATIEGLQAYAVGAGGALHAAAAHVQCGEVSEAGISGADVSGAGVAVARHLGSAWAMLGLVRAIPYYWQSGQGKVGGADMAAAFQSREQETAFAALEPIIVQMLAFVDSEKKNALALKDSLGKGEKSLLLWAQLISLYQRKLSAVADNPFKVHPGGTNDLHKLWSLFTARLFGRYG